MLNKLWVFNTNFCRFFNHSLSAVGSVLCYYWYLSIFLQPTDSGVESGAHIKETEKNGSHQFHKWRPVTHWCQPVQCRWWESSLWLPQKNWTAVTRQANQRNAMHRTTWWFDMRLGTVIGRALCVVWRWVNCIFCHWRCITWITVESMSR